MAGIRYVGTKLIRSAISPLRLSCVAARCGTRSEGAEYILFTRDAQRVAGEREPTAKYVNNPQCL